MSFYSNLNRRLTALTIQLNHADKIGISNTAKSAYYRSATILLCTMIEALVYRVTKRHSSPTHVLFKEKKYIEVQKLSPTSLGTPKNLRICERYEENVLINDVGFGRYLIYLKNNRTLTTTEYQVLNRIRKERNKIHMQGIDGDDTGYTKRKINDISKALPILLEKI